MDERSNATNAYSIFMTFLMK